MRPTAATLALAFLSLAAVQPTAARAEEANAKTMSVFVDRVRDRSSKVPVELQNANTQIDARKSGQLTGVPLAGQLSVLEVMVGIRSEQLNAWRDYTNALLALLSPEKPKDAAADPRGKEDKAGQERDPFDRESKLADRILERAAAAQRLKDAIVTLRNTLTPDQLRLLSALSGEDGLHIPRDAFGKAEGKSSDHGSVAKR